MVSQFLSLSRQILTFLKGKELQAYGRLLSWRNWLVSGLALASFMTVPVAANPQSNASPNAVQNDAYALLELIETRYAYADRHKFGIPPVRAELEARIPSLSTRQDLVAFSQLAFHSLYDHHSITGSGLSDAYGLVPSFTDLWVERTDNGYEVMDVRQGSPALKVGLRPGCLITTIEGQPIDMAINHFIGANPVEVNAERRAYAARVLTAGRRDRVRRLGVSCDGLNWVLELPNLYQARLRRDRGLVSLNLREFDNKTIAVVRFNDSLGLPQTINAFDEAIASADPFDAMVIDLRDTASGGNTLVARGILSRFVTERTVYQRHILPADERDFGVARSWLEEVSPRGEHISVPVAVVSGRWTASMGEGLTVAFDAIGVETFGTDMAGLLGGITDHRLPETDILVKLTTERLEHVDGTPREDFRPSVLFNYADAPDLDGKDGPMEAALSHVAGLAEN